MPRKSKASTSSAPVRAAAENVAEQHEELALGDLPAVLTPLENRHVSLFSVQSEWILRTNYDIGDSVRLHFQDPSALSIPGGDITLFERMFMAGLRLPFPDIAREFLLHLKVAPSQIFPNSWRYLFASFILWRTVIGSRMSIPQFLNVYRPSMDAEGVVKLRTRQGPSFIFLKPIYSNNKDWEKQIFRVSGEWECPRSMEVTGSQRISREWRVLDGNLANPPEISDAEQEEVARMIDFCNRHHKVENDFDVIVTAKSLKDHLGYKIPENKVPLDRAGRPKFMKSKAPTATIPPVAQRGTPRTREPPSRATVVEGTRVTARAASRGHDAPIIADAEAPLFREAGEW
jgi:hypothetical protein